MTGNAVTGNEVIREAGELVYMDDEYMLFKLDGRLYLEPVTEEAALTVENPLDRAVREAGFATEPYRHAIQELYECLYLYTLNSGRPMTRKERNALNAAKKLLGLVA